MKKENLSEKELMVIENQFIKEGLWSFSNTDLFKSLSTSDQNKVYRRVRFVFLQES